MKRGWHSAFNVLLNLAHLLSFFWLNKINCITRISMTSRKTTPCTPVSCDNAWKRLKACTEAAHS